MLEAYQFLVENYDRVGRDRIYIFGFSRGAYTARVLAGFIHAFGMMEKRNLNLLSYAFRAYKRINEDKESSFDEIRLYERTLQTDKTPIQCLGLFDTVASLIEWHRFLPRLKSFEYTEQNPSVISVRHAVAIDEFRTMFRPTLWPKDTMFLKNREDLESTTPQDVKEVWFSGVHGDVGGGYPEADSGLAKIPLHWMIDETQTEGLIFRSELVNSLVHGAREDRDYVGCDHLAKAHKSMTRLWAILEFLPSRKRKHSKRTSIAGLALPLFERRYIPEGATLHQSVQDRIDESDYAPTNLPDSYALEPWSPK